MVRLLTAVVATAVCFAAHPAGATLIDRGGGLIYDSDLNITWLQDADHANTGGSARATGGRMTWDQAVAWAEGLSYRDAVRGRVWNDWRLPATAPVNGAAYRYDFSESGLTDFGYNVTAPGGASAGSRASEMAHLFFQSLGNKALLDPAGNPQPGWGPANTGPFRHLLPDDYWSGSPSDLPGIPGAWYFSFEYGLQETYMTVWNARAWAVRDGDVLDVPEPGPVWLLGFGLLGILVVRRCGERPSSAPPRRRSGAGDRPATATRRAGAHRPGEPGTGVA